MRAKRYVMTARRKAALRKAQIASARKRRGKKPQTKTRKALRNAALVGAGAAMLGASAYGGYKGKRIMNRRKVARSQPTGYKFGPSVVAYVDTMNALHGQRTANLANSGGRRSGLRPNIPAAPTPNKIDREVFIESSEKDFQGRYGPWRGAHTAEERRRRKRLQVDSPWTREDRKKNIVYREALRRTNAYREAMARRGVRVNSAHMSMVEKAYQRMTY